MNVSRYREHRTIQALGYIVSHAQHHDITKLIALKLLYLADRYHLRKYGRPILDDNYIAMNLGPVASRAKDLLDTMEQVGHDPEGCLTATQIGRNRYVISVSGPVGTSALSQTDIEALDCAIQQLPLHPNIVQFTHNFPEWKKHEAEIKAGSRSIPMDYLDFFLPCTDPSVEYCDASLDWVALSRNIFQEDRQAWLQ